MELEVGVIAVSVAERSNCERLGWKLDEDLSRQTRFDPKRTSYRSFFSFDDPDGDTSLVQAVTTRLPGRI